MVKSKFSVSGFWFLTIMTAYSVFNLLSVLLEFFFDVTFLKPLTLTNGQSDNLLFQIISFSVLSVLFVPIIYFNAVAITIDNFNKIILFKNIFTKKERLYSFTELDGFVDTYYKDGFQAKFDIIYLVKNEKRVEKISGYYYSNYFDLKKGVDTLTYIGFREFYLFKNLKILFRKNVPD